MPKIFIVWDTTTPSLRTTLERLPHYRPGGFDFNIKGLGPEGGSIMNNVINGIEEADRVLVFTDLPNANVGFEAGIALGLGKPILLSYHGRSMPEWTGVPPLRNYLQAKWFGISELEELITNEAAWFQSPPAPPLQTNGTCLDLCPYEGTGEIFRRERDLLSLSDWIRPDELPTSLTLENLGKTLKETARLVWTITEPDPSREEWDIRDGAINAANGILAGWFYSRCYHLGQQAPFWVLRHKEARQVVDITKFERIFSLAPEYTNKILEIEPIWQSMREEEVDLSPSHTENETSLVRIAVIPFVDQSKEDLGGAVGITDDLRRAIDTIEQVEILPRNTTKYIKHYEIKNDDVAELFNTKYIVRGSLARQGDDCMIEVTLYRVGTSKPMRSYRRRYLWDDVLNTTAVKQIAKDIATAINLRLIDITLPQYDTKAKELFWQANEALDRYNNTRDAEAADDARRLLFKTLRIDDSYQEAVVQMGFLDVIRWETIGNPQLLKDSLDAWNSILSQDADNPVAMSESAYIRFVLGEDRPSAIHLARKAVDRNPNHPVATNILALLYLFLGYYESNVPIEKKVFKADPAYVYPVTNAALAYQLIGEYDKALTMARQAIDIDPEAFVAKLRIGAQYYYKKEYEKANKAWIEASEKCAEEVRPVFDTLLAWLTATKGKRDLAALTLTQYRGDRWIEGWYGPYYISLCALCGKTEEAVDLLEKATTFASSYRYLIQEPTLRSLYDNQRFKELLSQRYSEWISNLEIFGEYLPEKPKQLPDPGSITA